MVEARQANAQASARTKAGTGLATSQGTRPVTVTCPKLAVRAGARMATRTSSAVSETRSSENLASEAAQTPWAEG